MGYWRIKMINKIRTWFKDRAARKAAEIARSKALIHAIMFHGLGSDRKYNVDRLPEWDYPYYPERPTKSLSNRIEQEKKR